LERESPISWGKNTDKMTNNDYFLLLAKSNDLQSVFQSKIKLSWNVNMQQQQQQQQQLLLLLSLQYYSP